MTNYNVISNTQIDATTPPGMGAVVIAALELGETLADAHLGGLHYTYRSPAGSNGPAAVQAAPPLTSPSWLRPHLSVSGAADISRTSADANSSAGAPDLIPTEIVDGLRRASEVEIDYSGFLFALATLAEKAAPYLPELEAFLVANPEVVVALVVVATFFLVLGLAHKYGPSAFNALIDPSGTVVDINGNAVAGATVRILRSSFPTDPYATVDSASPGIRPRANPETANRSGGFHWDVAAGYYEVQASAPNCHAPNSDATEVTSPAFPIPPPKVGLTLLLDCADHGKAPRPTMTSVSPSAGPARGGGTVTVVGSGFNRSATVRFGHTPAQTVRYLSPEVLTVVVPPAPARRTCLLAPTGGTAPPRRTACTRTTGRPRYLVSVRGP